MQEIEDLAKQFAQIAERAKSGEPLFVGIPEPVVEAKVRKKRVLTEEQKARKRAYQRVRYATNREKVLASHKAHREANREKYLARQRAYYEANREKLRDQQKAHYQVNREKYLTTHKAYREANREKVLATHKAYREANPEKVLKNQVKRGLVKGIPKQLRLKAKQLIPQALIQANVYQILIKREIKQNEKCRTDA